MFIFDLTPDCCASYGHTNLPRDGNIRIELKLEGSLAEAVTVLYRELHPSFKIR
jgi:hypothetical protein